MGGVYRHFPFWFCFLRYFFLSFFLLYIYFFPLPPIAEWDLRYININKRSLKLSSQPFFLFDSDRRRHIWELQQKKSWVFLSFLFLFVDHMIPIIGLGLSQLLLCVVYHFVIAFSSIRRCASARCVTRNLRKRDCVIAPTRDGIPFSLLFSKIDL